MQVSGKHCWLANTMALGMSCVIRASNKEGKSKDTLSEGRLKVTLRLLVWKLSAFKNHSPSPNVWLTSCWLSPLDYMYTCGIRFRQSIYAPLFTIRCVRLGRHYYGIITKWNSMFPKRLLCLCQRTSTVWWEVSLPASNNNGSLISLGGLWLDLLVQAIFISTITKQ